MYSGLPHTGFSYILYAIVGGTMMLVAALTRAWTWWQKSRRRGSR